jgi:hypothetical protein
VPVEEISAYNGVSDVKAFVARIEAEGAQNVVVHKDGAVYTVTWAEKKKPGPKPKVETR